MKSYYAVIGISIFTFAVHLVFVSSSSKVTHGFPGLFCQKPGMDKAIINCSVDCHFAHNAQSGVCGNAEDGDYSCYCSFPVTTGLARSTSNQCLNKSVPIFQEICTVDCQCNHGGLGGRCNYDLKHCECVGSAVGVNKNMCPFTDVEDLKNYFNASYSYISTGFAKFADDSLRGRYSGKLENYENKNKLRLRKLGL